ncbi:MAG: esterase family protein [Alphaproteobacteria bacterium]|nr:esterase family protein [Alphaproteobacteria bacterium]
MRPLVLGATLLAACAASAREPRLTYTEVQSAAEGRPMRYGVYLPPGWDEQTPLPLVVFLHGGGDDELAWDKHPVVTRTLDRWIEDGRLPPFVAVVPNGDVGFWRDWHDGSHHYESWVMDEVIPAMQARFPLVDGPEGLHLMGISMGGAGTMYMGLDHLDRFGSLSVWSAPIVDAEKTERFMTKGILSTFAPFERIFDLTDVPGMRARNAYERLEAPGDLRGTRLLIGAGTADIPGALRATRELHAHLTTQGVPHTFVKYQGGHVYSAWSKVFPVALCLALDPEGCALAPSPAWTMTTVPARETVARQQGEAVPSAAE